MEKVEKDIEFIILKALKERKEYTSGEKLAKQLNLSRQALWKHIGKLVDKGYKISAVPHQGYRLISCPDKFYPWEIKYKLNTHFIGKEVYYKEIINSTQDFIRQLGLKGAPEGAVVFAEVQKEGRGRLQRQWVSSRGGIYFSLLLKPSFLSIQEVSKITLLIALGCLRGIKKATGVECSVKWPNDIFLGEKKLGGILCEMNAEIDRINFITIGVGINVNTRDLPSQATSLFLNLKKKVAQVEIAKRILEEIENYYNQVKRFGFSNLLKEWERFCFLWGKRVKVKVFNEVIEGKAVGIDKNGYLLLRFDSGLIKKISAGDITRVLKT